MKFAECIEIYAQGLGLPPVGKRMETVALLSLLELQPYHEETMARFGGDWKRENKLRLQR